MIMEVFRSYLHENKDPYLTDMTQPLLPDSPGGPTEDLQRQENVAFGARSGGNRESSSTGSKKRDRRTSFTGESSTPELPENLLKKRKTHRELIEHRPVGQSAKVLRERIGKSRESVMRIRRKLQRTCEQMPWPQSTQLQNTVQVLEDELKRIKKYIDEIEDDAKQGVLTEPKAKRKLMKAERKLKNVKEEVQKARKVLDQISQELENTKKLNSIFTNNMNHSPEYLREELYSVLPNGIEEFDHVGVNLSQVDESLPTLDDLHSKLYDKDNNKVDFPDFDGLQEAVDRAGWQETPDYLEDTAVEIETTIGKRIEIPRIRVLLSVAIKEMKDLKVEELEGNMSKMFKKWRATLNYAKEKGFDVEFAYNKVEKYERAYRSYREN
ncbi:hypothetical protein V6N13_013919 [Hibiscus sabdariffa]|uniref:Uncharacterized protein n=1 Tax=Hibiscus sabdariffa TaxID=183260 RepID=A0ABR2RU07_9ROSI